VETTFDINSKSSDFRHQQVSTVWYGTHLISVSLSGALNYLDEKNPTQIRTIQGTKEPFTAFAVSPVTSLVYTADQSGNVTTWDTSKGTCQWWNGTGHGGKTIVSLAMNADASHMWSVGLDNNLKFNELKGDAFSSNSTSLGSSPVCVAAGRTNSGLAVVVLGNDNVALIKDDKVVSQVELKTHGTCASFARDKDQHVAVGCSDGKIRVFKIDGDKISLANTHEGQHQGKVVSVNYTPENVLMSAGFDRQIFFWKSNDAVHNTNGWPYHNSSVLSSSFSSNGLLVTGSQDQNLIVWRDVKGYDHSKKTTIELAHLEGVLGVAFLKDDTLVSIGGDKAVKTWKLL
jgi:WD40 repeat protein